MADVLMSFDFIRAATGARLLSFAENTLGGICAVHIDSREAGPGGLFVALRGTAQDGHRYVEAAFKAGAAAALVSEAGIEAWDLRELARKAGKILLAVPNTLEALQAAAGAYLETFPRLLKIGVTGSAGKTTTKEIAAAMIGREKSVVMNPGNLNSETGLPLAVFGVRPCHEVGIFEMGMNRKGEIAELARVLKPHIALITNIGSAHIGILGSKEAIALEKRGIFSQFSGEEIALIPEEEPFKDLLARGLRGTVRFYGPESCGELGGIRDLGLEGAEILWDGVPLRFGLPGKHNLKNALAAAAIARAIPLRPESIRAGLESVKPLFGRSEILRGTLTVIRDCYNSSPETAAQAIAFCDGLSWPGRRVYVIGSMLELGEASGEAHAELGRILAASRADRIYLFGSETVSALEAMEQGGAGGIDPARLVYTNDMEELSRLLAEFVRPGDLVLLKGSRGCALERLTAVLADPADPAGPADPMDPVSGEGFVPKRTAGKKTAIKGVV
ncbi:MAG: UDP-N-acetylmuramoyl-tripeptide--D-alanyl-D-alanine ligase [Treponema sp.]|jgi:UDP-N-acetylmuramoyl-tripeptide--D-alanyl-D-alanine ligase|nr:UDP-N-acetylmuramoyl-tripeptide--D-alanyl-D-alanine ligase [Treponema sp.]